MDKYAQDKAEGKAKAQAEVAIKMLKENEPLYKIIRFTGLSEESVAKLKNELSLPG